MAQFQYGNIYGLKSTLEVLRRFEPDLYKQIQKDLKGKSEPLRQTVVAAFPEKPWNSSNVIYWTKYGRTKRGRKPSGQAGASFPKYDPAVVKRGVVSQAGGRKITRGRNAGAYPILRIKQVSAAGAIYDLAKDNVSGTAQSAKFVANLATQGQPSRVMWKTIQKNYFLIERDVTAIVNSVEKRFNAQIAAEDERRAASSARASVRTRDILGRFA